MKKIIMMIATTIMLFGFSSCAVQPNDERNEPIDRSTSTYADPEHPKVVAEAIVDTKWKSYGRRTTTKYYVNVMPNEESTIRNQWKVSKTMYDQCWHGDVIKEYDNGVVLCSDPPEKSESSESSDNGEG